MAAENKTEITGPFLRQVMFLCGFIATLCIAFATLYPRSPESPMDRLSLRVETLETKVAAHEARAEVLKVSRDEQLKALEKHFDDKVDGLMGEVRQWRKDVALSRIRFPLKPAIRTVSTPWAF